MSVTKSQLSCCDKSNSSMAWLLLKALDFQSTDKVSQPIALHAAENPPDPANNSTTLRCAPRTCGGAASLVSPGTAVISCAFCVSDVSGKTTELSTPTMGGTKRFSLTTPSNCRTGKCCATASGGETAACAMPTGVAPGKCPPGSPKLTVRSESHVWPRKPWSVATQPGFMHICVPLSHRPLLTVRLHPPKLKS